MPDSQNNAGARLRLIGVVILFLGLAGAGLVYGLGETPEDLSGDVATAATDKRQARAVEVNVGKMGLLVDNLMNDFQDPAFVAAMIAGASVLAAGGCFYISRLQARSFAPPNPTISN
jgi:hypothetical protein